MVVRTERLLLRPWRDDDLPPLRAMNADPEVMACFPAPLTAEESDALAARLRAAYAERGWGVWAVELHGQGFAGMVGLQVPAWQTPFGPCVEVLWRLARSHWGKGLATEAARAALDYGFGTLGLAEIVAFTALPNVRSRAVMERLGMEQVGEFDHPSLADGHRLRRHVLYRKKAP